MNDENNLIIVEMISIRNKINIRQYYYLNPKLRLYIGIYKQRTTTYNTLKADRVQYLI